MDPALGKLRLLAMSGVYRKEADVVEVQAAGADDFVSKSFKPEQLQLRVKKLLADQA
jgi:DNA-binding response OmpR family regulator